MDIQFIDLNSPLRVYYKSRNLTSGQDVIFSIWTDEGTQIAVNAPATGEIGTRGVYYLDITTPNSNTYIVVKGSLASGEDVASSVYAVGGPPSRKAWYADSTYRTSLEIPYQIFDITAAREVENDTLTEVAGGFYYADISEIQSQEDLFFKVGEFITQFDLRQLVIVSGGLVVGGAISVFAIYNEPKIVSGAFVAGEALDGKTYEELVVGGAIADGLASIFAIYNEPKIVSGAFVAGEALDGKTYEETGVGGATVNGTAIIGIEPAIEGGAVLSGESLVEHINIEGGKAVAGGEADVYAILIGTMAGGILLSGEASIGVTAPTEETIGGIYVGGSAEVFDTFWNYLRDKNYLYGIGTIVYLRYPSKDYLPSYYEQHQIEGIRIFGNHNLYDIGIGILVDEDLLVDDLSKQRLQSEEANYTIGYSKDKIDDLNHTPVLADPAGGKIIQTEDLSETDGGTEEREIAERRLDKLSRLSPLADPIGGEIVSTSSEENCCRLPNRIQNRLNRLKKIQVLPDPSGGTLQFSDTETSLPDITSSIQNKINRLQRTAVIPPPTGGVMAFSETDGQIGVETSSIRKKLDQLEDVAMIPGPTGAYIVVSMETESGDERLNELKAIAAKKIKKLIGV